MKSESFRPLIGRHPRCLILGSMPGIKSLQLGQYYAHPQNRVWWIMSRYLGFDPSLPYEKRCRQLKAAGIGLWDVLKTCVREGSLDSAIQARGLQANDIVRLCHKQKSIGTILLNGGKATEYFKRFVLPELGSEMEWHRLPSTSPAHARMKPEEKFKAWKEKMILAGLQEAV